MPINIKNERVSQLAVELAQLTGDSITDAVGKAVEERLTSIKKKKSRVGLAKKLDEISMRIASTASPQWLAMDIDAELYDELGMFKEG